MLFGLTASCSTLATFLLSIWLRRFIESLLGEEDYQNADSWEGSYRDQLRRRNAAKLPVQRVAPLSFAAPDPQEILIGACVRIKTVNGIVQWRLCLGCGACAYICPEHKITLVDMLEHGIRPAAGDEDCNDCRSCLQVCPAYENDHRLVRRRSGIEPALVSEFGPVLEVWEGYARDNEVRYRGASGGAITALALYCLEREHVHGVLHLQADPNDPVRNRTHLSRIRSELLSGTGSRYAPGSVCDGLEQIESAPTKCVFIGQPCEVTALRKAQELRPALRDKV